MPSPSWGRFVDIVRLRYMLQWAQIRRSTGRLIWFLLVQLSLLSAALLFLFLGLGSLAMAVRVGRAEPIAQIVLSVVYVNALVSSIVLGFGLNAAFSDKSLRRYPFSQGERFVIRHLLGLVEPLWIITAMAYVGAAAGAAALGTAPFWVTAPVALVLMVGNYLLMRLALGVGTRLLETSVGSFVLVAAAQLLFLLPMASQYVLRDASNRAALRAAADFTAPVAAGSLLAGHGSLSSAAVLVAWCLGTAAWLWLLDRRPEATRHAGGTRASWNSLLDRVAAPFPGEWAPLIARSLRFFLRNQQVRLTLLTMFLFVTVWPQLTRFGTRRGGSGSFELTVLMVTLLGSATSAIALNVFGFDGTGLRRLLLAPARPIVVLGASSIASMIVCSTYILLATGVWASLATWNTDVRMPLMLVTQALTGMFVFHAMALWGSILTPARADYFEKFRRQASGGSQVLMFVFLALLGVAVAIRSLLPGDLVSYWWLSLLVMLAAAAGFAVSLHVAAQVLPRRRERLLSIVEGRI